MNTDYLADGEGSFDFLSPWNVFRETPLCWASTLAMVGCLIGCIVWARRLCRKGRPSPSFPGPLLLALVPITIGVLTSFWFLRHFIQMFVWASSAGIEGSSVSDGLVAGIAAVAEFVLGLGAFFSYLAIAVLILIHRTAKSSAAP